LCLGLFLNPRQAKRFDGEVDVKKGNVLNADISALVARLGHTDQVVIGDAGLPIPASTLRIDLALTHGV